MAVDAALARGEPVGPLAGVPFTCKDPFPVAGMRSPNGSRLLADYTCATDCEPVRRLRAAGAILLGKTNVSEFSMHWDSTNALFGSTRNPHDLSRSAGGSSGWRGCRGRVGDVGARPGVGSRWLDPVLPRTSRGSSGCAPAAGLCRSPPTTRCPRAPGCG